MIQAKLILVGGFLGSGKTTLLREAASRLTARGHAVGLVTNDQAPELVDTTLLLETGAGVREVAGSCFCCDFHGLAGAVKSLIQAGAQVVMAEPVGSCTDLTATIMQPLAELEPGLRQAPLSVLADPRRVREALGIAPSSMHPSALYILRKQLEESDVILLNKADTLTEAEQALLSSSLRERFQGSDVAAISARTGEGVSEWLDSVMRRDDSAHNAADVDYDVYAEGEAVLGWLNATVDLAASERGTDLWRPCLELLDAICGDVQSGGNEIGHIKAALESSKGKRFANLTGLGGLVNVPDYAALHASGARLILNLRVQIEFARLEAIARKALDAAFGGSITATVASLRCFSPARPQPTYRYSRKV